MARIAARVDVQEGWHLQSTKPALEYLIPTQLTIVPEAEPNAPWPPIQVTFPPDKEYQAIFEAEPLLVYEGNFSIVADVPLPRDLPLGTTNLLVELSFQACDDRVCVAPTSVEHLLTLNIAEASGELDESVAAAFASVRPETEAPPTSKTPLPMILLFGVIGGLILNAMPCVLPILSLKVVGMVKAASGGKAEVTRAALATAAGIFVSFMALAGAAALAKSAGQGVGWGIQFQNPGFVTFLLVVLVLFCLNLWGLFEIPLPGVAVKLSGGQQSGGLAGHFSSGLFATLMATPCSAPFLGSAVGFALSQSSTTIFLVFAAIAFGMSLPYLILAVSPSAVAWFPKPGAWMEHLKGFLGFLLAATAVWLFYVLAAQVSAERLAGIQIGLLAPRALLLDEGQNQGDLRQQASDSVARPHCRRNHGMGHPVRRRPGCRARNRQENPVDPLRFQQGHESRKRRHHGLRRRDGRLVRYLQGQRKTRTRNGRHEGIVRKSRRGWQ